MRTATQFRSIALLTLMGLGGCAGVAPFVAEPGVSLRNVHAEVLDFDKQTFLLSFDVTNPNPFPLPLTEIHYGIRLDGKRFASGQTPARLDIPAGSDGEFAIRVEMDLIDTVPDLLFTLRESLDRAIPYSLEGELHTAIPGARPVRFESIGAVRLLAQPE